MKEFMDYAVRNWGFENDYTLELFRMIERGEPTNILREYVKLADIAMKENWGFEM